MLHFTARAQGKPQVIGRGDHPQAAFTTFSEANVSPDPAATIRPVPIVYLRYIDGAGCSLARNLTQISRATVIHHYVDKEGAGNGLKEASSRRVVCCRFGLQHDAREIGPLGSDLPFAPRGSLPDLVSDRQDLALDPHSEGCIAPF